jgi:hypothetical protein
VDFWWDSFPGNTGNCWYGNIAAPGRAITSSPPGLPTCAGGTRPDSSIGTSDVANEAELVSCFAGFQAVSYPTGTKTLCSWTVSPATPRAARAAGADVLTMRAQRAAFAAVCRTAGASRTCAPYAGALGVTRAIIDRAAASLPAAPVSATTAIRPLALYTCSWWRQADTAARQALVQRIAHWVGGAIGGRKLVGYGSVLDAQRAAALFDDRCSYSHAEQFALYKLYGAAAGFAGLAP